jgi:small multidrug resistance pump
MAVYYTSLAAAVLLGVRGQILLKLAADGSATFIGQFLNSLTIIGFAIYIFAALCYVVALKNTVSIAFPSASASYAIVAVPAHLLWNKPLGWSRIAGLLLIEAVCRSPALNDPTFATLIYPGLSALSASGIPRSSPARRGTPGGLSQNMTLASGHP